MVHVSRRRAGVPSILPLWYNSVIPYILHGCAARQALQLVSLSNTFGAAVSIERLEVEIGSSRNTPSNTASGVNTGVRALAELGLEFEGVATERSNQMKQQPLHGAAKEFLQTAMAAESGCSLVVNGSLRRAEMQ